MTKLELTPEAKRFHRNLHILLKYLAVGAELTIKSGHIIVMVESGEPGFLCQRTIDGQPQPDDIVIQVGSDVAWQSVTGHAKQMTDSDFIGLAAAVTLNERY